MGRAPCCDKASVKKGPWSPEEDAILKNYIDKYGTGGNWIALPTKIAGLKRCGKSCRLRWLNYLRPNLKHGGFTQEEDNIICSLYISIGSRWSIIAAQLPGRTDNDIKNYWNTRLKKKLFGRRKQVNTKPFTTAANVQDHHHKDIDELQQLSNSAVERLQLHMQLQTPYNTNHPILWPRLNPLLHQAMIHQNLQFQQTLEFPATPRNSDRVVPYHDSQIYSDHLILSPSSYSDGSVAVSGQLPGPGNMVDGDQKGIEGATGCFMPQLHQEQQYFKDNMVWWSNNYNIDDETPSGPSVSWDVATATSFLHSDQGI